MVLSVYIDHLCVCQLVTPCDYTLFLVNQIKFNVGLQPDFSSVIRADFSLCVFLLYRLIGRRILQLLQRPMQVEATARRLRRRLRLLRTTYQWQWHSQQAQLVEIRTILASLRLLRHPH